MCKNHHPNHSIPYAILAGDFNEQAPGEVQGITGSNVLNNCSKLIWNDGRSILQPAGAPDRHGRERQNVFLRPLGSLNLNSQTLGPVIALGSGVFMVLRRN